MLASGTEEATSPYHITVLCKTIRNMDGKGGTAQGIMQGTGSSPVFTDLCSVSKLLRTERAIF